MSSVRTTEEEILAHADALLSRATRHVRAAKRQDCRLRILEAVAARLGGFNYRWYCDTVGSELADCDMQDTAEKLLQSLQAVPIPAPLALSALSRPVLSETEQRRKGVYYTDYRLANYLASTLPTRPGKTPRLLDPACGTGSLLTAAVLSVSNGDQRYTNRLLRKGTFGADLSRDALRGAALSLASLTSSKPTITELLKNLRQGNSLVAGPSLWSDVAPAGFDVIIGNPPWEKLKVTRHEYLRARGVRRHYGHDYGTLVDADDYGELRRASKDYSDRLRSDYPLSSKGEPDYYKFFIELALQLGTEGSEISYFVPAGLIRSLGTEMLRRAMLAKCDIVDFGIIENRLKFFPIDSRFKFLALRARVSDAPNLCEVRVSHPFGGVGSARRAGQVRIRRDELERIRTNLSLPEVRTRAEWLLFRRASRNGVRFGDEAGPWRPRILREVDMSRHRKNFLRSPEPPSLPLIEGRMVHQYSHASKQYVSGTGRRALWKPATTEACVLRPQFWLPEDAIPVSAQERVHLPRVGFCDITGQTNERTMLAARIPAGTVCGNKVPTILFDSDFSGGELLGDAWLAVANSFVFDWLLRRTITTTVNFFILEDVAVPNVDDDYDFLVSAAEISRCLNSCSHSDQQQDVAFVDGWDRAEHRAEAEWLVAGAYGLTYRDMELVLRDFPLLDRSQPALEGERKSTVTRDLTLLRTAEALGGTPSGEVERLRQRVQAAHDRGAVPFVPSHLEADRRAHGDECAAPINNRRGG